MKSQPMRDVAVLFRIQNNEKILLIVRKKRNSGAKNLLLLAKNIATFFEIV